MIEHIMIISSDYIAGKRIALHYAGVALDKKLIDKDIGYLYKMCGNNVKIAVHRLITNALTWQSVMKADLFFEDIMIIDDINQFIDRINKSRLLTAVDIANYILTLVSCTPIKLQKLVYLSYAEYLRVYNKKMFHEPILAYQYGPAIQSLLDRYDSYHSDAMIPMLKGRVARRSRLLFAQDGSTINEIICKVLEQYGEYSAENLITLTHQSNTPWSQVWSGGKGSQKIISDDIIKKGKY